MERNKSTVFFCGKVNHGFDGKGDKFSKDIFSLKKRNDTKIL